MHNLTFHVPYIYLYKLVLQLSPPQLQLKTNVCLSKLILYIASGDTGCFLEQKVHTTTFVDLHFPSSTLQSCLQISFFHQPPFYYQSSSMCLLQNDNKAYSFLHVPAKCSPEIGSLNDKLITNDEDHRYLSESCYPCQLCPDIEVLTSEPQPGKDN